MTQDASIPTLALQVADTVKQVMAEIRPKLIEAAVTGNRGESENERHEDNFLSVHDMYMHDRYRQLFEAQIGSFVYASEEGEPQVIGDDADPDLCILVDPLDTSELAVRGLLGYTHVLVYSRSLARPVVAVVGDIYHHVQLWIAGRDDNGRDVAFIITRDGDRFQLTAKAPKPLSESLVTNYLMKPDERFIPLAAQSELMAALNETSSDGKSRGRIGVDFGSVSLCHVAAGFTEATIEFAKGFAIWDLAPGHYVLHAAGGAVLDLNGTPVPLDYNFSTLADIGTAMDRRQFFVAAGNQKTAEEIVGLLQPLGR
jgi:myo-inositol-1(or 4)-monophosphatase